MNRYESAKEIYAKIGIDTDLAIEKLKTIPVSLHCWQGDDVKGFDTDGPLTGGIQTTGNYPGRARTPDELMADMDKVMSLCPGKKKLNVHACYAIFEDGKIVDRDKLEPKHFQKWVDFAKERNMGIDFNPTFFSHPKVKDGLTLSSPCGETRKFWIEHGKACIRISQYFAEQTGVPCVMNIWTGDGYKDIPADRMGPRMRYKESIEEILSEPFDKNFVKPCVESKVFGIGVEAFTSGSAEFSLTFAATHDDCLPLMDNGHYHPTEMVSDKIPALLCFFPEIALHITRPIRWDSDHVVLFDDETREMAKEIVRCDALERVYMALDYFDASINRISAWTVGFVTQYDHYMNLIANNPEWTLVDIYKDDGITGTEMECRDDFNRMYQDCVDGKLDLILTKSISRFARNTYDCIDTTRKFKILGVDIIFEKENIDTSKMTSETELAALSSMAQEESISLSQNVRLGIQHRMKNGTFKQGCIPYGYYLGENGEWKINEEQAKIVRLIFNAYINGMSLWKIAEELKKAGVIKNNGSTDWGENRIRYIIKNERYKGDALLQKTYTEDFPFKSRTNHGEKDMYYVKNSNPAIVTAEIFEKANELLKAQGKRYRPSTTPREHTLSKMIYCEECGTMFRKKSGEVNVYWVCRTRDYSSKDCPTPQVAEKAVMNAFVNMYNRLVNNVDIILTPMLTQLTEYKDQRMIDKGEIANINKEIAELTEQVHVLQNAKANGYIEPASFMERMNEIATRTAKLRKDKKFLLGNDECEQARKKTEMLVNYIRTAGPMGEFDKKALRKIVTRILVNKDKDLTFELINGLKLKIKYSEVA